MRRFRRPKKKALFLAVAVLVLAASVFLVARNLTPGTPSTTPGTTAKPSKNDTGLYLDKGDLWQWVNGRKTQLTKLGTIVTFDWHPAGGELVYVISEADGSYKAVDRKLASKQELVIYQGKTEMWPKVLCSSKGVLLVEASPTTIPRLLQLTMTSVGYDGTTNGSFWTQVPLTKEQFARTTDGKTLVYELGIYGSSTSADGKTAPLTYETWQYVEGSRKPKLIVKSNPPSLSYTHLTLPTIYPV